MTEKDVDPARPADQPERPEPADAEEPAPAGSNGRDAALSEIAGRLGRLEEQLAGFHRRSAHRESVIDRLHEENQQLRGGFGRIVLEPVVTDLIRLYDQLSREVRRLRASGQDWQLTSSFADDVALILDRCGVEAFSAEPGDRFEPDRHRPLAVVACADESRHNTVAEVVAVGFAERETGRVRRPVHARFHQYTPGQDEARPGHDAAQSQ